MLILRFNFKASFLFKLTVFIGFPFLQNIAGSKRIVFLPKGKAICLPFSKKMAGSKSIEFLPRG